MVVQSNTKIVERILNCKQVLTRSGSGDICKIMILSISLLEIEEGGGGVKHPFQFPSPGSVVPGKASEVRPKESFY